MAWVYEARHPQFPEKRLAVKLMKPEFAAMPMMRDRFLREAQLLARIGHPHLVSVHSFGVDDAHALPVLRDGLHRRRQPRGEARGRRSRCRSRPPGELYDRVLGALAALHREGVIHRDIKPLNIFLWRSGEPMLADLGIARDTASAPARRPRSTTSGRPSTPRPSRRTACASTCAATSSRSACRCSRRSSATTPTRTRRTSTPPAPPR